MDPLRRVNAAALIGLLLVLAGILALLSNLNILNAAQNWIWALIFALAGIAFLGVFSGDRAQWWALIPGFALFSLAGTILLSTLIPRYGGELGGALLFGAIGASFGVLYLLRRDQWWPLIPCFVLFGLAITTLLSTFATRPEWGGAFFLGAMGLGFGCVYLVRRDQWWAIIPGGVLITLAFITALARVVENSATAGILFLGMAATFGVLYFTPAPQGHLKWAVYPAAVLLIMGLAAVAFGTRYANLIWPALLVAGGVWLLVRGLVRREGRR